MATDYTLDECILVLDLYRRLGGSKSRYSENNESVRQMAEYISQHFTQRNPKSISNKLDNFRYEDTGIHGLENGGRKTSLAWMMCKTMTDDQLSSLVKEIRERIEYKDELLSSGELDIEENSFTEEALKESKPG